MTDQGKTCNGTLWVEHRTTALGAESSIYGSLELPTASTQCVHLNVEATIVPGKPTHAQEKHAQKDPNCDLKTFLRQS